MLQRYLCPFKVFNWLAFRSLHDASAHFVLKKHFFLFRGMRLEEIKRNTIQAEYIIHRMQNIASNFLEYFLSNKEKYTYREIWSLHP